MRRKPSKELTLTVLNRLGAVPSGLLAGSTFRVTLDGIADLRRRPDGGADITLRRDHARMWVGVVEGHDDIAHLLRQEGNPAPGI